MDRKGETVKRMKINAEVVDIVGCLYVSPLRLLHVNTVLLEAIRKKGATVQTKDENLPRCVQPLCIEFAF